MKKRIISFILCMAMCCAIFPASAFAAGPEPKHEENLTPELLEALSNPVMPIAATNYETGNYYRQFKSCFTTGLNTYNYETCTGDQRHDIVLIARSQIGYHEGSNSNDLTGSSSGTANYTEYGRMARNNGAAWGGYFIYWLGLQVGYSQNLMWLSTVTFDKTKVKVGDLVLMRNGENLGIVIEKTSSTITILEGNYSDKVVATTYYLTDSRLSKYVSPSYGSWTPRLIYYSA